MTLLTYCAIEYFLLCGQRIEKIKQMGRRKKLTAGRISAKKKWKELNKSHPRQMYGRQTKEYRRKTSKNKVIDEAPIIKNKVDPSWNTEYINGPPIPNLPQVVPWYANMDGRKKEVKDKRRLQKLSRQLPDIFIISKITWWHGLPDIIELTR